jgi:hypothetical protein
MFVTPVCFSGLVLDLFWLLNKVVKVLELCTPLAMANLDRYPLFCAFWHIIMQNGLRYYFTITDTESDYQLCYIGWGCYVF